GTLQASFAQRSYAPGDSALLTLRTRVQGESFTIFRCGPPAPRSERDDTLDGVSVRGSAPVTSRRVVVRVGDWPSGLYLAQVDVLADEDLARVRTGAELKRLYDLVVFPGHEEYVTPHAYAVVQHYRDRGGHLLFLSANNFFYRVVLRGHWIYRTGHWRDLGRDGEQLTGLVYGGWSHGR